MPIVGQITNFSTEDEETTYRIRCYKQSKKMRHRFLQPNVEEKDCVNRGVLLCAFRNQLQMVVQKESRPCRYSASIFKDITANESDIQRYFQNQLLQISLKNKC